MTTKLKNGGPAFPAPQLSDIGACTPAEAAGMTLRDYFAAAAWAAWAGNAGELGNSSIGDLARWSYRVADAMLAERAKGGETL